MIKKTVLFMLAAAPAALWAQCTITNATGCDCLDGSDECDLLPDITASYDLLAEPGETNEYPGLLTLSVGTPNIGHGPLRVLSTDNYVCGGDTIYSPGGLSECPDGTIPSQIIKQRIYHKSGSTMSYWERDAGTMTYHPAHGHFHTDNWGIYTIRKEIDGVENPLEWPIIGYGTKTGFCLMDYANCASPANYGYCREDDGTVVTNGIENYGLGGGGYNCAITNQGISVGYLDIYGYWLDGMSVNIPDGVCNGDYMLVVQLDPNLNYIEESDDNNVIYMPITLTEQPEDVDFMPLTHSGGVVTAPGQITMCASESVELSAAPVGYAFLWSNGETTSTITVTEPGDYYCSVSRDCGPLLTDTIHVEIVSAAAPVVDAVDPVCTGESASINATGAMIQWWDSPVGGTMVGTGNTFTTPALFENTMYYAENVDVTEVSFDTHVGQVAHEGSDYSTGSPYNGYEVFTAYEPFTLESVKVETDYAGVREIELRNSADVVLQSLVVDIPVGTTVIDLNFDVPAGTDMHLGTNGAQNTATFGDIHPKLKRSTNGTSYPYDVDGVLSITNSSFDETRWYYFYDWHVNGSTIFDCPSDRVGSEVEVLVCNGVGNMTALQSLNVYPNPGNGQFNVALSAEHIDVLDVVISNATGQEVYHRTTNGVSGDYTLPVDISALGAGVYQVQVRADGGVVTKNIVVE
ncbi:MAG: T9SS type A sorting domain-containing protein [Chitinophagales bacterium]